ncbi:MAG: hypothetical protein QW767_05175 [Thermoprotei archaeon]
MQSLFEAGQRTLRQLYMLRSSVESGELKLILGWDILRLYLARGSKSVSIEDQLAWAARSNTLASLFKVLREDSGFRKSVDALEAMCPLETGGVTVDQNGKPDIRFVCAFVRVAAEGVINQTDASLKRNLVSASNSVLDVLLKELVPCSD